MSEILNASARFIRTLSTIVPHVRIFCYLKFLDDRTIYMSDRILNVSRIIEFYFNIPRAINMCTRCVTFELFTTHLTFKLLRIYSREINVCVQMLKLVSSQSG